MNAPEQRFSERVESYVKHRPTYPVELLERLRREAEIGPESVVADVGAGTGIFTAALLGLGCQVIAVEPNVRMREAAEEQLGREPKFQSRAGSAEATGLEAASVDLVTAAQAFHWFRPDEARREFQRILRPLAAVALAWNHRRTDTPFLADYESLLVRHSPEYARSAHRQIDDRAIARFFGGEERVRCWTFPSGQSLDLAGLKGRLESSSYAPRPGSPEHAALSVELQTTFARHASEGRVEFAYETRLYLGRW